MSNVINDQNINMYYVSPTGVTVQGLTKTYKTCSERDKDLNPARFAWVLDASEDPTVNSGAAFYFRKGKKWQKLYESEAMDNENGGKPEGYDELVELVNRIAQAGVPVSHINDRSIHTSTEEKEYWNNKLDPEEGKGLSQNDFTNSEKEKLSSLRNYDDTGIRNRIENIETEKADISVILGLQNRIGHVEEELIGVKQTISEIQDIIGINHDDD